MSQPRNSGQTVNRAELASLCGVSLPTVDTWVDRGCPFLERGSKGREWKFDTAAVIGWRIEAAVTDTAAAYGNDGAGMSAEEANRRRAVAFAHMAEIDLDERLQRTIGRDDMHGMVADFCLTLRGGISNALDKIAARGATITSPNEIRRMGEAEWNRALRAAQAEFHRLWDQRFGAEAPPPILASDDA